MIDYEFDTGCIEYECQVLDSNELKIYLNVVTGWIRMFRMDS